MQLVFTQTLNLSLWAHLGIPYGQVLNVLIPFHSMKGLPGRGGWGGSGTQYLYVGCHELVALLPWLTCSRALL